MLEEKLSSYLKNYRNLGADEAQELEQLISKYPWFNAGHILLAKAHKNQNRYSFKNLLKKASLHAGDRTELFELMHDRWDPFQTSSSSAESILSIPEITPDIKAEEYDVTDFSVPEFPEADKQMEPEDEAFREDDASLTAEEDTVTSIVEDTFTTVDSSREFDEETPIADENAGEEEFRSEESEQDDVIEDTDPAPDEEENADYVPSEPEKETKRPELDEIIQYDPIEALKPLVDHASADIDTPKSTFSITPVYDPEKELIKLMSKGEPPVPKKEEVEAHDFTYWLEHLDSEEEDNVEIPAEPEVSTPDAADILDQFIKKRPSIRRIEREFYSPEKQSQRSIEDNSDIVSESLGHLYLKQGFPDKAVEVFGKLRLQNPQKDAYFARLIQEVKQKKPES